MSLEISIIKRMSTNVIVHFFQKRELIQNEEKKNRFQCIIEFVWKSIQTNFSFFYTSKNYCLEITKSLEK